MLWYEIINRTFYIIFSYTVLQAAMYVTIIACGIYASHISHAQYQIWLPYWKAQLHNKIQSYTLKLNGFIQKTLPHKNLFQLFIWYFYLCIYMYVIFSFLEYIEYMYVNHCLVGNISMKRLNPFFSLSMYIYT